MKIVKPYLTKQIEYEERYYEHITELLAALITYLLMMIKQNRMINSYLLNQLYGQWVGLNQKKLDILANNQTADILKLSYNIVGTKSTYSSTRLVGMQSEIKVYQENTLNATFSEVMKLLPIGIAGLYTAYFSDETTKQDLFKRANTYAKRLCQGIYTDGVINSIFLEAKAQGYTGYIANNQHDDRVRKLHREYFDGKKIIEFNNPPPCSHVGVETNCRCYIIGLV